MIIPIQYNQCMTIIKASLELSFDKGMRETETIRNKNAPAIGAK
ncbi:hypothetical protein HMPREF1567_3521 [Providencia alcalifaciens PAL-2]|nr:hypothetical protein HMPREF1567_3521 [Providencia alcalifaciens PAL-2]